MSNGYLPAGLPIPVPDADNLSAPYLEGLSRETLLVQQCPQCGVFQMPPGWICHACHSFGLAWAPVEPEGRIYSWTRCWHPVHPALKAAVPYVIAVVELRHADGLRMVGNLLGDPTTDVVIGAPVAATFEHHPDADPAFSLMQWKRV